MIHARRSLAFALFLALTSAPAAAQWSDDPTVNQVVVDRAGDQALPKSASTPIGERWVAWFDNASGNYDVYVQFFDNKGHACLGDNGMLVSANSQSSSLVNWDLIATANGECVLVFTDTRDGGDLDVHAYRIDQSGVLTWGANGVTLSANSDFEADPMVCEATDGELVFVWNYLPSGDGSVVMQRLSAVGVKQFVSPVTVAAAVGETPGFASIVPSTGGDVIVAWVRDLAFSSSVKDVRAERFDDAGASVWGAPTEVFDAFNVPIAYSPKLISDEAGGAVLTWHASNPGTNLFESSVQRLDGNGLELFAHNGVQVAGTATLNHISPVSAYRSSTQEIFTFWNPKNSLQSESGVAAQKIDSTGTLQWGSAGKVLMAPSTNTTFPPEVVQHGDGAIGIFKWQPTGTFGDDELRSVRLDNSGDPVWAGTFRDLCTLSSGKSVRLAVSKSVTGDVVVFWEDDRNGNDDIYGQNVRANGELGAQLLFTGTSSLSLAAGGTVVFSLEAGTKHAFKNYRLLGSINGTSPGVPAQTFQLPLNNGPYFQLTLTNPGHPLLGNYSGTFDNLGLNAASLTVPAGFKPGLAGRTVNQAYVVLDGGTVIAVSEARGFLLTP